MNIFQKLNNVQLVMLHFSFMPNIKEISDFEFTGHNQHGTPR
jgi:hypothetical protein